MIIACVLRGGGSYDVRYVRALARGVRRHLSVDYDFVCLTDERRVVGVEGVRIVPLLHDWPGWWSKIELFRLPGPVLYFDLDTVICGSIAMLAHAVECQHFEKSPWIMLRPFNPVRRQRGEWASGVMGWRGSALWIYEAFRADPCDNMRTKPALGDQRFISEQLRERNIVPTAVQEWVQVESWKHSGGLPNGGARIVCFHGHPRPHDVREHEWMQEHWDPT